MVVPRREPGRNTGDTMAHWPICPLLVALRLRAEHAHNEERALSLLCASLGFGEVI